MNKLKAALAAAGIEIQAYSPEKARPIKIQDKNLTVSAFSEMLQKSLGKQLKDFPEILDAVLDSKGMLDLLDEYATEEFSSSKEDFPNEVAHLTLNVDRSSSDPSLKRFFCTDREDFVVMHTSGQYYMNKCGLSPAEASVLARPVIPTYLPRSKERIVEKPALGLPGPVKHLNTYVPPAWEAWKRDNPGEWDRLPAKPAPEIIRLIKHIIPSREEREYLYTWTYLSLTRRAYVYLILCGQPGVGKNRLKLLLRALHGAHNSADGKKETIGANQSKFNSQLIENTFIWFDELAFGPDMEPRMKEYQNDFVAIERKGMDTTRSTEIYCSMVISNNYPRNNYLLFNSRKFAPLVLGDKALTAVMEPEEIASLSERVDDTHPKFDVKLIAQTAKWIMSVGSKHVDRWPNLEYQGPKFWELAHTSMSRWQKIAVLSLTVQNKRGPFRGWDEKKEAFLWSKVEEALRAKREYEAKDYRDATTVRAFFETYRDKEGRKVFEVENADDKTFDDFWIKPIAGLARINMEIKIDSKELYDLGDIREVKKELTKQDISPPKEVKEIKHKIPESKKSKIMRPPGISQRQWRNMKEDYYAPKKEEYSDGTSDTEAL